MNHQTEYEKDQEKPGLRHRVPQIRGIKIDKEQRAEDIVDVGVLDVGNDADDLAASANIEVTSVVRSENEDKTGEKSFSAPAVRKPSLPVASADNQKEVPSTDEKTDELTENIPASGQSHIKTDYSLKSQINSEHEIDSREAAQVNDLLPERPAHRRFDPALSEEVLSVDPRFIGRVFSVEVQDVKLPDGRQSKREIVRHPGGACVVALDSEQHLYLVRQHRVGTGGPTREIPAGKLDLPEDPIDCARRELTEETGLVAERWDLLTRFYPSPGYTDETISIYLARGLSKGFARPDDGEFISVERIHLTEALNQIREGLITDGKTCLGIYMAADLIGYFS